MTIFLFSLAGIPPLGGWLAKFRVMEAVLKPTRQRAWCWGVFVAVNSVIALYYYARIGFGMWAEDAPDGDLTPVSVPMSLGVALTLTAVITIAMGVIPGDVLGRFTEVSLLAGG